MATLTIKTSTAAKLGRITIQSPIAVNPLKTVTTTQTAAAFSVPESTIIKPVIEDTKRREIKDLVASHAITFVPEKYVLKNHIVPSVLHPQNEHQIPESTDALSSDTKKFEPYEKLTGISKERPEIVMMTDFQPFFDLDETNSAEDFLFFQTNACKFFELQLFMRSLKSLLIKTQLTLSNDPERKKELQARKDAFKEMLSSMEELTKVLSGVIITLETLKDGLNLKTSVSQVSVAKIANDYVKKFSASNTLVDYVNSAHPSQYSVIDVMALFGYDNQNVLTSFSSTKIWMQLLLELKHVLLFHSARFLNRSTSQQAADNNAVNITSFGYEVVALSNRQPLLIPLRDIKDLTTPTVPRALKILEDAYNNLYTSKNTNSTVSYVATLLNIISKEYRYSVGLNDQNIVQILASYYGYTVGVGNQGVFDSILGRFGNNITDFASVSDNTLVSYAQRQVGASTGLSSNIGVLTLESKYVDGTDGTLTPGSEYYVDEILRVSSGDSSPNVSRLEDFIINNSSVLANFSSIVRGMNLLIDNSRPELVDSQDIGEVLSNPRMLLKTIASRFVDGGNKVRVDVSNDLTASVFEAAENVNRLKTLLFMYFIMRITRVYRQDIPFFSANTSDDNTQTTELIIQDILSELDMYARSSTATQASDDIKRDVIANNEELIIKHVKRDAIQQQLRAGTSPLLAAVESLMIDFVEGFKRNVFIGDNSRFGGHIDTAVVMVFFDVIVTTVRRFMAQTITGKFDSTSTNIDNYVVSQIVVNNHTGFISNISNNLVKETTLSQQAIFTVMSVLQNQGNMFSNVFNLLSSKQVTETFGTLSSLVVDPEAFQVLMSEQQIAMLVSNVTDLIDQLNKHTTTTITQTIDVDSNDAFDGVDEVVMLDTGLVSPRLRDATLALLSLPDFSTKSASNKRIMSVGLPAGFVHSLNQRVNIRNPQASFDNKQRDIITVNVYKTNLENTSLVFKPQKFMFELSRFPVRNDKNIAEIQRSAGSFSIDDIVSIIPTRVLSTDYNAFRLEYFKGNNSSQDAFNSESYSFMTAQQKRNTIKNHVVSLLLEVYINAMTGMKTAEFHFPITDSGERFIEPVYTDVVLSNVLSKILVASQATPSDSSKRAVMFAQNIPATTQLTLPKTFPTATALSIIDQLPARTLETAFNTIQAVGWSAASLSSVSNPTAVSQFLLQPKKFDRIFNIIFDPDDFELDRNKSVGTKEGKALFESLLHSDVLSIKDDGQQTHYLIKERDRNVGDITFDKYFIAIETFGETT